MRLLPYGDRALLVEVDDTASVVALVEHLRASPEIDELVLDVVPGARTVLLVARPGVDPSLLRARAPFGLVEGEADPRRLGAARGGPEVEIPVHYDGPDLAAVAELTGLGVDEVVAAHTTTPWQVAFAGFAPGFAYLAGGDPRLHVPRHPAPRPDVPAGAVGLAGEFSGIYPRSSPGGWQLIGHTDTVLWDLDRDPPALLRSGTVVRFVEA